ncbi:MAG: OsmC family protein [Bacteroidales bacterium]|nr:OsmC family protein [Bacteroidales bacterium]MBN2632382.1 OsmC family protein [Bacteroidales bacterium]
MSKKETVQASWLDDMAFEIAINGHKFVIDAEENVGGADRGPRPKNLMLAALGGCTGMDVVSILKKMRVDIKKCNVFVQGELTEEHPKYFHTIHTVYEFAGHDLPVDKLQKAISLSEERYCGVSAVYNKVIKMTSEIKIIES